MPVLSTMLLVFVATRSTEAFLTRKTRQISSSIFAQPYASVESLRKRLAESTAGVQEASSQVDIVLERRAITDLEIQVSQERFWDNAASAQRTLQDLDQRKACFF